MAKENNKNITIRILAVFIATIMWVYVMGEVNPRITKEFSNIKVTLKNEESVRQNSLYVLEPEEVEISVKLNGRRNDIMNINEQDIKAYIDLRGAMEGEVRFPIEIASIDKLEIESYEPKEALFKIDEIVSKNIPVTLNKVGTVESGFNSGDAVIKPASVLIRGPRSRVNSVYRAVATVDTKGAKQDINVSVPYKVLDDKGKEVNLIEKEPINVDVSIPIYKVKSLAIEPQIQGNPFRNHQIIGIKTLPNLIEVMGYEEDIKDVSVIKTKPIDVSFLTSDYSTEIELIVPQGLQVVNQHIAPKVEIMVQPIIDKSFEYTVKDITFINLEDGLRIDDTVPTSKITITIRGIKSVVDDITRRDLTLYMDLKGLTQGQHDEPIKVLTGDGIDILEINPQSMKIILEEKEDVNDNNQKESTGTENNQSESKSSNLEFNDLGEGEGDSSSIKESATEKSEKL